MISPRTVVPSIIFDSGVVYIDIDRYICLDNCQYPQMFPEQHRRQLLLATHCSVISFACDLRRTYKKRINVFYGCGQLLLQLTIAEPTSRGHFTNFSKNELQSLKIGQQASSGSSSSQKGVHRKASGHATKKRRINPGNINNIDHKDVVVSNSNKFESLVQ